MSLRILFVEDDRDVRRAVLPALVGAGHTVVEAWDGAVAVERLGAETFDAVVSDIRLPKVDGMEVFRRARALAPTTAVILMTSFGAVVDAVAALREGAHDYLTKPFDVDELVLRLAAIEATRNLRRELEDARARLAGAADGAIVCASPSMVRLLDKLSMVADSDAPVLVTGETGTGKELVARRLHARSRRRDGAFVALNCAAFPESLLEAELFGHARGAFTGADRKREGRFKMADGGTLFLDEVGEMPLAAQAKLLRVLQERVIEPLGSDQPVKVDVRVVSATHRDLKRRIAEGSFREDLYYRLNVVSLHIPPLRERPGDLPLLVRHFLEQSQGRSGRGGESDPVPEVSVRAWQALSTYPFLGNVRELGHAIQHAVLLSGGRTIDLEHLPEDVIATATSATRDGGPMRPLAAVLKQAEREHILKALALVHGKRAQAAELLGISRKNLWEKLKAHGLSESDVEDA